MEKMRLGRSGLRVSRIGMGGIPLVRPTVEESIGVVHRALELGVNFIDTATGYGESEERIGRAIAGRRAGLVLATKAPAYRREQVRPAIQQSLRRLGVEHIDLWQFHGVNNPGDLDLVLQGGAYEEAMAAQADGLIGHIGITSHNPQVSELALDTGLFETLQYPFDFVADDAAHTLVPQAKRLGVGFIAMKPFAGGNIRDARLAIKYLLQFDNVMPDPGIEKVQEIEEIVALAEDGEPLGPQDFERMTLIREELGTRFCRQCMYCMPCPNGVHISMVNYVRSLHKLWPREHLLQEGWWRDSLSSGHRCTGCGICEPKCPYNLPIRQIIAEHTRFYDGIVEGTIQ